MTDSSDTRDWRDPQKPVDPEDEEIGFGGWRRKADGTWEKIPVDEVEQGDKGNGNSTEEID